MLLFGHAQEHDYVNRCSIQPKKLNYKQMKRATSKVKLKKGDDYLASSM